MQIFPVVFRYFDIFNSYSSAKERGNFSDPNEGKVFLLFIFISAFLVIRWTDKQSSFIWIYNLEFYCSLQIF